MRTFKEILDTYTKSWEDISFTIQRETPNGTVEEEVHVAPPYVMNTEKYIDKTQRHSKLWRSFVDLLTDLQKEMPGDDYMDPTGSIYGKGRPEIIKSFLDQVGSKIQGEKDHTIRDALIRYGIGIDCSGFVTRAIGKIMQEYNIPFDIRKATLGTTKPTSSYLRSNATILRSSGSDKLTNMIELQPSDIQMYIDGNHFHILIVIDIVEKNTNSVRFITAEASSVPNYLCVRRSLWQYQAPNELLRYDEKKGEWKKPNGWDKDPTKRKYTFARPKAFCICLSV